MGKINFHFVTENNFNTGTKNSDHLYFVNKTSYVDLYKGSLPVGDPNVIKNGQDAVLSNITASGNITTNNGTIQGKVLMVGNKNITDVATIESNGMMSATDKVALESWTTAQSAHYLNGTIKIGNALLSFDNDALKVTFI